MDTDMDVDENPSEANKKTPGSIKNPLEHIITSQETVGEINSQYKYQIQPLTDLPNEFTEVNACFPRTKQALSHITNNLNWDEESNELIQLSATTIETKAKDLQQIFSQVADNARNTKDETVTDCYTTVLQQLGKSYRVEVLLLGILKAIETLLKKKTPKPNCSQTFDLKDIIEKLSKVKPSVQDSDLATSGLTNIQNNTHGGTGHQYNGRGHQIFSGGGNMTINNHVLLFRDDDNWSGKSPIHSAPGHMDEWNNTQHRNPETSNRAVGHDQLQHRRGQAHTSNSQAVNQSTASRGDRPRGREDFHIAIICALPLEYDVVSLLFDQFWDEDESYGRARGDTNTYTTGRMGQYNVVLILLPNMGTIAAAGAAASFRSSYPSLQLAFLVGICGGVPWNGENEIHLGDVIISKSAVQYDLSSEYHKAFVIKDTVDDSLGRPNKNIRSLVKSFETERIRDQLQQKACLYLKQVQKAGAGRRRKYSYEYPGIANDKLFIATYRHKHRGSEPCKVCDNHTDSFCERASQASCAELGCDERQLVRRTDLEMRGSPGEPEIFVGRIASGNVVMKSGEHRDKIAHEQGVVALEMEGAGVWDEIPCIIVKGVCDYADSHRNDLWQRYAAATAASVMKAVLGRYIMTDR